MQTDSTLPAPARRPALLLAPGLLALALLLAATALRAADFAAWPPGLTFDEGTNGLDALRFARTGVFPFSTIVGRPEPLHRVLVAVVITLVGPTRFGLRLTSLYLGVLGVATAYRAGRHFAPPGSPARRWTGLLAAGTLAVMVGHVTLSRVGYRGIALMPATLLFFDTFVMAWQTGRRRAFIAAGVWLGLSIMTYTSALALLPLAALGIAHQSVARLTGWNRPRRRPDLAPRRPVFWPELAAFVAAFTVAASPMMVRYAVQPDLYGRVRELRERDEAKAAAAPQEDVPRRTLLYRLGRSLRSVYEHNDKNPQYNANSEPLLHTPFLVGLAGLGVAVCLLRPRRLVSWMTVGMAVLMLFPLALSGQIPHGLRIAGEYAALPLVMAASTDPVLWLAGRVRRPAWSGRALLAVWGLAATAALVSTGVLTARIYAAYFSSDLRWGRYDEISGWTWFFETRRAAVAAAILDTQGVAYVPLTEANHPTLRYLTAARYPRVATFADYFPPTTPLALPPGRFFLSHDNPDAATFAAFMPDGTVVLLPRFDRRVLAFLRAAAGASGARLYDAYGEFAATVVDFPTDPARPILIEAATGHTTDVSFEGRARLVGWDAPDELPERGEVEVTLYFTPEAARRRDVYALAQLWTLDAERLSSSQEELLLHWLYPPDQWREGQIVPAVVAIPVPEGLDWGAYEIAAGLSDHRHRLLNAFDANGLLRPDGRPAERLVTGEPVTLTLYWEALQPPAADYTIFVHLHDASGELVAQHDGQPAEGRYPTSIWDVGDVVATSHPIILPPDTEGPYLIFAGLYEWPSLERLPVHQDGQRTPDGRALLGEIP